MVRLSADKDRLVDMCSHDSHLEGEGRRRLVWAGSERVRSFQHGLELDWALSNAWGTDKV
jgi:hypothetical protein